MPLPLTSALDFERPFSSTSPELDTTGAEMMGFRGQVTATSPNALTGGQPHCSLLLFTWEGQKAAQEFLSLCDFRRRG